MSQKSLGGNMASVLLPFAVIPTSAATRENLLELLLEERSFVAALLRMTTKGKASDSLRLAGGEATKPPQ